MLLLTHLENKVVDVSSITSLTVVTAERKLDQGRNYSNYEILATVGNESEVIVYSVPAEQENQNAVKLVYRNIIALMSGNIITPNPQNVYSVKAGLASSTLYDQSSFIAHIEPYFP